MLRRFCCGASRDSSSAGDGMDSQLGLRLQLSTKEPNEQIELVNQSNSSRYFFTDSAHFSPLGRAHRLAISVDERGEKNAMMTITIDDKVYYDMMSEYESQQYVVFIMGDRMTEFSWDLDMPALFSFKSFPRGRNGKIGEEFYWLVVHGSEVAT